MVIIVHSLIFSQITLLPFKYHRWDTLYMLNTFIKAARLQHLFGRPDLCVSFKGAINILNYVFNDKKTDDDRRVERSTV